MIPYGHHYIDEDDIKSVVDVLKGDFVTCGPKVEEFEAKLASYVGAKHGVAVNSGASALDIAVGALGLSKGSEIITTPLTFVATSNCILHNGCVPVFADIEQDTRNIAPDDIRKKITAKTKAIICMDYAGHPCDIKKIQEIAKEHNLFLIEDACHALGAEYQRRKIGSFADMTVFSFHPVKHISTGEGGAVVTDNEEFYRKLKMLRNHGIDKTPSERISYRYDVTMLGRNCRMTEFQAALGISQLRKLDEFIKTRTELASAYGELLKDVEFVQLPLVKADVRHAWHIYTVLLDRRIDRDEFFKYMRNAGIGVNVHYIPIYKHSYYANNFNFSKSDFPVTENVFRGIITLPLYPGLGLDRLRYVVETIKKYGLSAANGGKIG